MTSDSIKNWPAYIENVSSGEVEAESNNIDSLEAVSSGGDSMHELERAADALIRVELDIACSFEWISDIKMQSANFRRALLASSGDEKWKDGKELDASENCSLSDLSAKIKIQTAEQQKNVLRMLEKSLAREMDLEKRLTESREAEEDLKFRLQQEVFCIEGKSS